ncbi:ribosome-binding factor A [Natronospira proteinivora]|uniref:Ribosome-binding factor A n=1 Tax=Natronospira proteinivora TaxID=1807133 RepID=A0ABT1GAL7_9GAMM|nr:30S ribosome-binding factor RbfA [Natronospira proteinivora]MCP1726967.1 ribosome-binding factor A [Natronospira proteinivora]
MKEPQTARQRKLAEEMKRRLSLIIREEVDHDAAWQVTVTAVEVAKDLSRANVWVDFLGDPPEDLMDSLKAAGRPLRARLGRTMYIRRAPELVFMHDDSLERGSHLSSLIDQAVSDDRRRQGNDGEPENDGDPPKDG